MRVAKFYYLCKVIVQSIFYGKNFGKRVDRNDSRGDRR